MDDYIKALNVDSDIAEAYYKSSFAKTEQQKFLESLLASRTLAPTTIADIACGAGSLSYHLKQIYSGARFSLVDINPEALRIARSIDSLQSETILEGSIYELPLDDNCFDLVFCWQTLFVLEAPQEGLLELLRITKPNGRVFVSSLFNVDSDVDICARLVDHTRRSAQAGLFMSYNTYCLATVESWLQGIATQHAVHPFAIGIDLEVAGRGLGTRTIRCTDGSRLQVSGGLLMHWGILEIQK